MLKKIIRYIPGVAVPMVINFALTLLYARYLDPGEYGVLNIYLNTVQIIYAATTSVFQNASLRFYSLKNEYRDEKEFLSTYVISSIITTVILLPILFCTSMVFDFNWWIIALSVGFNGLFQLFCNFYRVKYKSKHYNLMKALAAILSLIAFVLFLRVIRPLSFEWPIVAVYGSYALISIIELIRLHSTLSLRSFSKTFLKRSLQYGFPLIGVSILGYIIANSDQYFLLYYLGKEAVGNYALGHRLVDALVVNLLTMILLVMTPELNKIHDEYGEQCSVIVLKNMINAAVWIILPISFAIIVYANDIIDYVFPAYTSAAQIMQLVVFASMFHGISMFTCKGLELVKHPKYIFCGLLAAAIINCLYNWIFIPVYGINASAHSSLLAYLVYNIMLVAFTNKYYDIKFDFEYLLKAMVVTGLTVAVALIMMKLMPILSLLHFWVEGMISVIAYLSISYLFGLTKIFTK